MSKLTYERAKQLYTPYDEGQMRHLCALRDVEIDRLQTENDKLRELVEDMHAALQAFCDAQDVHGDNCPLWVERTDDCELRGIERRMSELRVEVDE